LPAGGTTSSLHPARPARTRTTHEGKTVLVPLPEYTDRAFAAVVMFYELEREGNVAKAVKLIRAQIMNLQEYDWKKLVKVMEEEDARKS